MKNWLKKRFAEPTTYLGLAMLMQAAGMLGKINEAPVIADSITAAAEPLARGDYATGSAALIGGLLAIVMREKGGK